MNRREILRTCMQSVCAVGLVAIGYLSLRGGRNASVGKHTCVGDYICRRCGESPSCILPQALSYRKAKKKD